MCNQKKFIAVEMSTHWFILELPCIFSKSYIDIDIEYNTKSTEKVASEPWLTGLF